MSAQIFYNNGSSSSEIITHLINATDGAGLHFDGTSGNIDIAAPPDLGAFAVYINNGAGYPTTTTTIAVDPLLAEIPAGTVLTFREGGEFIVTTAATPTAVSLVSTSGLTGAAVVDNEGAAFGGANKFSFEFIVQADSWTDSTYKYLVDFGTGGRFILGTDASAGAKLAIYDNTGTWKTFGVSPIDDLKVHHQVVTIDGTAAILYDNGNLVGTVTISASHGIDNCTDAKIGSSYTAGAGFFPGNIFRTRFWNKTLSQTDVTSVYESASLDFADQWGSQTDKTTNGTFASDTGWTKQAGWTITGGNAVATAAGVGSQIYQVVTGLTVGKRYRLSFTVSGFTDGSVDAYFAQSGETGATTPALTSAGTTSIEDIATSASQYVSIVSRTAASDFTVSEVTLVEIGCVSDYDLSYANPTQSAIVQNRSGSGDGTAAGGVTQITAIEAVNTNKLNVGGTVPLVGIGLAAGVTPDTPLHVAGTTTSGVLKLDSTAASSLAITTTAVNTWEFSNAGNNSVYNAYSHTFKNAATSTGLTINNLGLVSCAAGLAVTGASTLGSVKSYNDISLTNSAGGDIESWIWTDDAASTMKIGVGPISSANAKLAITATGLAVTGNVTTTGAVAANNSVSCAVENTGTGFSEVALATDGTDWKLMAWGSGTSTPNQLSIYNQTSDTHPLSISSAGLATFSAGIAFQSATTGAGTGTGYTLDSYEEGTFTATLKGATTEPATLITIISNYTKIGNRVYFDIGFENIDTTGYVGDITITGMPFTNNGARNPVSIMTYKGATWSTGQLSALIEASTAAVHLYSIATDVAWTYSTHNPGAGRYFWVSGSYKTWA
jgi:hypothetical protein